MTFNRQKALLIGTYGLIHGFVDFCCAAMLFSFLGKVEIVFLLQLAIIYNSLAFGLQFIFGLAADKFKRYDGFAIFGCLLLIFGIILYKNPLAAMILMGIGNALFHVGGGVITLEAGNGRAKLSGLFVAPGAVGLFLGTLLSSIKGFNSIWLGFLPLIGIALMLFIQPKYEVQKIYKNEANTPAYILIILLILISICIRSFVGLGYDFAAKNSMPLLFTFVFAIALGKAVGGFLSDKFGMFNVAVIGLLLSIPLLKYGFIPQLAILGMFFFNLTMPITMTALANMMPKFKGFSFGLTTLALLIGYLPVMCEYKVSQSMLFFEILFASVVVTAISLKLYEKLFHRP